jgi:DNA-binding response OmpR family regulator
MRILVITGDETISSPIIVASRLKWPKTGKVVIIASLNDFKIEKIAAFNCVIIDGELKDNAIQVINSIRRFSAVPIVFVANPHGDQIDTAFALTQGIVDYLFKPLEIGDVINSVESITSRISDYSDVLVSSRMVVGKEDTN